MTTMTRFPPRRVEARYNVSEALVAALGTSRGRAAATPAVHAALQLRGPASHEHVRRVFVACALQRDTKHREAASRVMSRCLLALVRQPSSISSARALRLAATFSVYIQFFLVLGTIEAKVQPVSFVSEKPFQYALSWASQW